MNPDRQKAWDASLLKREDREEIAVTAAAWAEYAAGGFHGGAEYGEFLAFLERCRRLPWWQEAIDRLKKRGEWDFGE